MAQQTSQRIVDAHIHWWDLENNYYPWLMDEQPEEGGLSGFDAIAHTYLYEHYMEDAAGYDVEGFVHVQAEWDPSDPVGENRWRSSGSRTSRRKTWRRFSRATRTMRTLAVFGIC